MLLRSDITAALAAVVGIALAVQADGNTQVKDPTTAAVTQREVSFAEEVLPILEKYCVECHSEESAELGLKLDTYEGVMGGSDYGTVVEAGDVGSLLIEMIASGDMPDGGDPMPAEELDVIKAWVTEGAQKN
ncbi:MAG TPA: hypothetical protein DHW11_03975 [Gemmatimonadetes bacterium]|nr:hypothetical protein [Gemmatimonadota bacterium]HCW79309.1 hypothetical protein [Gemmatimonadota bacterium]|tara:strand:+ start:339 stop:734 length:396 start_codon:yes stop_codon:yes gene_type:complete